MNAYALAVIVIAVVVFALALIPHRFKGGNDRGRAAEMYLTGWSIARLFVIVFGLAAMVVVGAVLLISTH